MSLPTCPSCIYAKGICKKTGVEIRLLTGCTYHVPKPITRADRIRAMSDHELADLFANYECGYCRIHDFCVAQENGRNCEASWLAWLRQEAPTVIPAEEVEES